MEKQYCYYKWEDEKESSYCYLFISQDNKYKAHYGEVSWDNRPASSADTYFIARIRNQWDRVIVSSRFRNTEKEAEQFVMLALIALANEDVAECNLQTLVGLFHTMNRWIPQHSQMREHAKMLVSQGYKPPEKTMHANGCTCHSGSPLLDI